MPRLQWAGLLILVLMAAGTLRFFRLDLVPLHHDEGVNGNFLRTLLLDNEYHYDPSNYHGPTLYYLALPLVRLLGLTTFAVRSVTGIFGMLCVALMFTLRKHIGAAGALAAALLLALSPGAVYISRYFIHEMICIFCTLAIVSAFANTGVLGRSLAFILACALCGLYLATKETAPITLVVLAIAGIMTHWTIDGRVLDFWKRLRAWLPPPLPLGVGLVLLAAIVVVFYTSFGTYPEGLHGAAKSLAIWAHTGTAHEGHDKPFDTYIKWMFQEESAILLLGVAGTVMALVRRDNAFVVFTAWWTMGILAAYSLVAYKTPWLTLNIVAPLAIMAGYAVTLCLMTYRQPATLAVLLVACGISLSQCIQLNFYDYDNDQNPYVYVHTQRGFLDMIAVLNDLASKNGGYATPLAIVSPDYWPLPWYIQNYTSVAYSRSPVPPVLMIAEDKQQLEVEQWYPGQFVQMGTYPLRPGVHLTLYVRRDAVLK